MRDPALARCRRRGRRPAGTGDNREGRPVSGGTDIVGYTGGMQTNDSVTLTRDVEASVVPVGTKVTLQKGEQAHITQSLGGAFTVIVNGNMFRIESKDADALGLEVVAKPTTTATGPVTQEQLEKQIW